MKYFFFDIDGTLSDNRTKKIVPSAYNALQKLQENGHFVCIATGRAHYKALSAMDEIGVPNMVCNGGNGIVIDHKFVENVPLPLDKCLTLIHELESKNIGFVLMLNDSIEVYSKDNKFREQVGERLEPTTYIIDESMDYDKLPIIYKIYAAIKPGHEDEIENFNILGHIRFEGDYIIYQPDNKKGGIELMMNHLKGDVKDVVVFGDDYNDLCMFDAPWMKIAVGNACQPLKDKADFVTKANIDDGIEYALKKFGWID